MDNSKSELKIKRKEYIFQYGPEIFFKIKLENNYEIISIFVIKIDGKKKEKFFTKISGKQIEILEENLSSKMTLANLMQFLGRQLEKKEARIGVKKENLTLEIDYKGWRGEDKSVKFVLVKEDLSVEDNINLINSKISDIENEINKLKKSYDEHLILLGKAQNSENKERKIPDINEIKEIVKSEFKELFEEEKESIRNLIKEIKKQSKSCSELNENIFNKCIISDSSNTESENEFNGVRTTKVKNTLTPQHKKQGDKKAKLNKKNSQTFQLTGSSKKFKYRKSQQDLNRYHKNKFKKQTYSLNFDSPDRSSNYSKRHNFSVFSSQNITNFSPLHFHNSNSKKAFYNTLINTIKKQVLQKLQGEMNQFGTQNNNLNINVIKHRFSHNIMNTLSKPNLQNQHHNTFQFTRSPFKTPTNNPIIEQHQKVPSSQEDKSSQNPSLISSKDEIKFIKKAIQTNVEGNKKLKGLNLIFNSSVHGGKLSKFHSICDETQNTLIVIRTKCGKKFGGFTGGMWDVGGFKSDNSTFLFSLSSLESFQRLPKIHYSIFTSKDYICFGENDLKIPDNFIENGVFIEQDSFDYSGKEDALCGESGEVQIEELIVFECVFDIYE